MSWKLAGDIVFTIATIAAVLFVATYGLSAPFWRSETGRNLMGLMSGIAIMMVYFGWAIWSGGVPHGLYPMRAVLFSLLAYFLWRRFIILVRAQLMSRREKRDHEPQDAR
jgi:hypothetical protein